MVGEKDKENVAKPIFEGWGKESKSLWRLWNKAKKWMPPQFALEKVGGGEASSKIAIGTQLFGDEVAISKDGQIKLFFEGKLLIDTADENTIFIKPMPAMTHY